MYACVLLIVSELTCAQVGNEKYHDICVSEMNKMAELKDPHKMRSNTLVKLLTHSLLCVIGWKHVGDTQWL